MPPPDYLAKHGRTLLAAGYEVVPIAPGYKYPRGVQEWQTIAITPTRLDRWLANGHAKDGVGIRTATAPAVDIDVTDPATAEALDRWCQAEIGLAPVRIGRAPKRLLAYRADTPFPKQSSLWIDREGRDQKVEVLGEGQQYVAWAVHPDTGRPYQWSRDSPLTLAREDLEPLTLDDARRLLAEFDRLATAAGWTRKRTTLPPYPGGATPAARDDSDALAYAQDKPDVSDEDLKASLDAIAERDDYDTWLAVGMALHHHYDGTDDGLELWREWSSPSAKYDDETIDKKWPTFAVKDGRQVKTARYILALGKAVHKAQATDALAALKAAFGQAATLDDLRAVATRASEMQLDPVARESLLTALRGAWKRIEGGPVAIALARAMLRRRSDAGRPNWLQGWAYLTADESFLHRASGRRMTHKAFNAAHDRYLLGASDEENKVPKVHAVDIALNVERVEVYDRMVYMPNEAEEFWLNGQPVVNSYRTDEIPAIPDVLTDRDRRNIEIVIGHYHILIQDRRECDLFLSWCAYIPQTNSKVNWAPFLQGVEGDGKSFLATLLAAILGASNVKSVAPQTLSAPHNAWAAGAQVAIIEEVKLQGHNKHDVLNAMKPLITNPSIEIHAKFRNPEPNVPNTQSYVLLSNYADALPLAANDTRYFPIRSRFQTRKALAEFTAANPDYYKRLFNAVDESPGALRKYFLDYKLHPEFDPKGRAPWSRSRDYMASMAASNESDAVATALAETTRLDVTTRLLDQHALQDEVERHTGEVLKTWEVRRYLSDAGWTYIARMWVKGAWHKVWSQEPERWVMPDGSLNRLAVAKALTEADM